MNQHYFSCTAYLFRAITQSSWRTCIPNSSPNCSWRTSMSAIYSRTFGRLSSSGRPSKSRTAKLCWKSPRLISTKRLQTYPKSKWMVQMRNGTWYSCGWEKFSQINLKSPRCRVAATNDFSILAFPKNLFLVRKKLSTKVYSFPISYHYNCFCTAQFPFTPELN